MENPIVLTPKERIKKLILPKEISEDLAYFCGVLAGDGSIGFQEKKKDYWIKCVGNPADEKEFYDFIIKPLIKRLFNLEVNPKYFDKRTTYGIGINSKSVVYYLTQIIGLPLGKKYEKLRIPEVFLKENRLARNFICGLADTDFHLQAKKGYYPVIAGVSKSKSFIAEIKEFLEKDGFKCYTYERKDFDKRVNKLVLTYSIYLYGYSQYNLWMSKIGFKHPKVSEKIKLLNKSSDRE